MDQGYIDLLEEENSVLEEVIDEQAKERDILEEEYIKSVYKVESLEETLYKTESKLYYRDEYIQKLEAEVAKPHAYIQVNIENNLYDLLRKSDLERVLLEKLPGKLEKDKDLFVVNSKNVSLFNFKGRKEDIVLKLAKATQISKKQIELLLTENIKSELLQIFVGDSLKSLREIGSYRVLNEKYKSKVLQLDIYRKEVNRLRSKISKLESHINFLPTQDTLIEKEQELEKLYIQLEDYRDSQKKMEDIIAERDNLELRLKEKESEFKDLYISIEHFKLSESDYVLLKKKKQEVLDLKSEKTNLIAKVEELENRLEKEKDEAENLKVNLDKESKKSKKLKQKEKELKSDKFSAVLYGSFAVLFILFISVMIVFEVDIANYVDKGKDLALYAQQGFNEESFERAKLENNFASKVSELENLNKYTAETTMSVSDALPDTLLSDTVLKLKTQRDKEDKDSLSTIALLGDDTFKWELYKKGDTLSALKSPYYNKFIRFNEEDNHWDEENSTIKTTLSFLKNNRDYTLSKTSLISNNIIGLDSISDSDIRYTLNYSDNTASALYNDIFLSILKQENLLSFLESNDTIVKKRNISEDLSDVNIDELLSTFRGANVSNASMVLDVVDNSLAEIEYSFDIVSESDDFTLFLSKRFKANSALEINEEKLLENSLLIDKVQKRVENDPSDYDIMEGEPVKPEDLDL